MQCDSKSPRKTHCHREALSDTASRVLPDGGETRNVGEGVTPSTDAAYGIKKGRHGRGKVAAPPKFVTHCVARLRGGNRTPPKRRRGFM
jgi:hypothetical protein